MSSTSAIAKFLGLGPPRWQRDDQIPCYACVSGLGPWKRIRYSARLVMLSPQEREAACAHEITHWRELHVEKRWLLAIATLFLGIPWMIRMAKAQELEADRGAALAGHRQGMISFLARLGAEGNPLYPTPRERIDALMRLPDHLDAGITRRI